MAKQRDIWKFNDDEWKVHIKDVDLCKKLVDGFGVHRSTVYYQNGGLSEETAWDVIVPNDKINKVKKFLKDNT
jgi:hypothetical protein|tara:strand:+ start:97 stop:315 length:219 start_codon:yes stop_codon:yes gene_type:complete